MGQQNTKDKSEDRYSVWLQETLDEVESEVAAENGRILIEFERFHLEGPQSIKVALVGKTGVGKSRPVNALIDEHQAYEGDSLSPGTKNVAAYKTEKHGIEIEIFDAPGVQDGTDHENEYLQQISQIMEDVDWLLYCVRMNDRRFRPEDSSALEKFIAQLRFELWKKSLIVLTFANEVPPNTSFEGSPEKYFLERLTHYRDEYTKQLQTAGVKFDVPCTPVGDIKKQELPICKDWLPVFWIMALKTIDESIKSSTQTYTNTTFYLP